MGTALVRGQRTNSPVAHVVHGHTEAFWIEHFAIGILDGAELRDVVRAVFAFTRTVGTSNAAQVVVQQVRPCGTGTMRARSAEGGEHSVGNAAASHPTNRARPRRICRASNRRSSLARCSRPTGGTAEPSGAWRLCPGAEFLCERGVRTLAGESRAPARGGWGEAPRGGALGWGGRGARACRRQHARRSFFAALVANVATWF